MIEGLIIPRSYNAYINKTDAVGVLHALQLPNVMDSTPTAGSNKPVTSSGIKAALDASGQDISELQSDVGNLQEAVETAQGDISNIETALAGKQDALTFDNAPTSGSDNPAKSGGIKTAIDTAESNAKEWATTAYFGSTTETGIIDITVPGLTALRQGMKLDLICSQVDDVSANGLQLRINNSLSAEIKVLKNNSLQSIVSHTGYWEESATSSTRVCDANTHLDLVYNGTEWQIMGNPILCSYFTSGHGSSANQRNSYIVYADGLIHQWGTMDNGSASRDIKKTVNLLITHKASGYMTNFTPVAPADQQYYVGNIGIKAQTVNSFDLDFYGTGTTDMSRWLKWEVLGI